MMTTWLVIVLALGLALATLGAYELLVVFYLRPRFGTPTISQAVWAFDAKYPGAVRLLIALVAFLAGVLFDHLFVSLS